MAETEKKAGLTFGRYQVVSELGRGSMGVVYKARDPVIGRMVAVKSIPETFALEPGKREEFIRRLRQEATTAGRLQHPNIVTIFDVGESEAGPYIAMEFLDGVTLREVVAARKTLSLRQLHEVVRQVGEGLDYAHAKAVIHRDIKPANLMIVQGNLVKIMDLGIARIPFSDLTKEGKLVGSPSYMSPEQLQGQKIDGRSDLFSLGVTIYQCMTLKKPFPGENINEICMKIVHGPFTPPTELRRDLPKGFDRFMETALAKDPDLRFQNGAEMVGSLEKLLADRRERSETTASESVSEGVPPRPPAPEEVEVTSNPNLMPTSEIEDIFRDLTSSHRLLDLRGQRAGGSRDLGWLIWVILAVAVGLLLAVVLLWKSGG